MQTQQTAFFDGLTDDELRGALAELSESEFPSGSTLLAEGDAPHHIYVIKSGTADVWITDRRGVEHRINSVGPGGTVGEMSIITGQPVTATVRATSDLRVLVLSEADVHRIAARFPRIYRNIGTILSDRLARSNRRSVQDRSTRVTVLLDYGAPPLLGYALAGSIAWHTRAATVLLVVSDDPSGEIATLTTPAEQTGRAGPYTDGSRRRMGADVGAHLVVARPDALNSTLEDLTAAYEHVLIQVPGAASIPTLPARTIRLAGLHEPLPDSASTPAGHTIRGWSDRVDLRRPGPDGVLRVPLLTATDEHALKGGLLPATSGAGRALGWAARDVAGMKVGLALGAGSSKGYAHIGVLRVLERAGIPIDYISGTSIGSGVAALHALGHDPESVAETLDVVGAATFRPTVPTNGILSSAGLRTMLQKVAKEARIEDLRTPLAVVAADIITRQEVVFRRGPLWPAVLASMSIPGVYPPHRIGAWVLVDGGVLNPVPSTPVAELGADVVIAVKLGTRPSPPPAASPPVPVRPKLPSVLQTLTRSIEAMQSKITTDTSAAATIQLEPIFTDLPSAWGLRNFSSGRRFIELGERVTEEALPRIAVALPWVTTQ